MQILAPYDHTNLCDGSKVGSESESSFSQMMMLSDLLHPYTTKHGDYCLESAQKPFSLLFGSLRTLEPEIKLSGTC